MQIARGVGSTIATIKDEIFSGRKLLPVGASGSRDESGKMFGTPFVAVDTVDAGTGDLVLVAVGSTDLQADRQADRPTSRHLRRHSPGCCDDGSE
jgi:ethanolamine utilization protein EutN